MIEKIVLIGAVAVNKTAVGKALAEQLEMFFTTTDELIEYENGNMAEVKQLFGENGVEKYKNRTLSGLKDLRDTVIVAYDNCLETDAQRAMISENSLVVHLYGSSEMIFSRLKKQGKKGLYSIYEIEEIQRKLLPIYNKMADVKISINRKTQDAVVSQIVKAMGNFVDKVDTE